ncbi:MAG: cob(I)yrinic acid a,c-diamide adenosyltransferase [Treponema sp.]|jgi:cob(I)alamin adenosyltransferase|nr:cob(I)yrinic acid a,c-diamide adenosyltransferase [Treponema sp.]
MGIYSGNGDLGKTSTLDGKKLSKNDILIHFEGTADELNSHLGLVKALLSDEEKRQFIEKIQINLMKLMSHVSDTANEKYIFSGEEVKSLEKEIDRLSEKIKEQLELVIPGKNTTEAQIHIARTVARKAERLFFAVNENRPLSPNAGAFLNRLSDYLFVLSQSD